MKTIKLKSVKGSLPSYNWNSFWKKVFHDLNCHDLKVIALIWIYEEVQNAIEIHVATSNSSYLSVNLIFTLPLDVNPIMNCENISNKIVEFEEEMQSVVKHSWKNFGSDLKKSLSFCVKLGLYFSPEFPNSPEQLTFLCGDRIFTAVVVDLSTQLNRICKKFDLDLDYFTALTERPKTLYLTQGEVTRKEFALEMVACPRFLYHGL